MLYPHVAMLSSIHNTNGFTLNPSSSHLDGTTAHGDSW